jgi:hypothetical protein
MLKISEASSSGTHRHPRRPFQTQRETMTGGLIETAAFLASIRLDHSSLVLSL